jgi:hypothetical protein
MNLSIAYSCIILQVLPLSDVVNIALTAELCRISPVIPARPCDGKTYVFDHSCQTVAQDYVCSLDHQCWRRSGGCKAVRKVNPVVACSYFHEVSNDIMNALRLRPTNTLVVYKVFNDGCHVIVVHYCLPSAKATLVPANFTCTRLTTELKHFTKMDQQVPRTEENVSN